MHHQDNLSLSALEIIKTKADSEKLPVTAKSL